MITLKNLENQSLRTYPSFGPTPEPVAELDRLGDQIAELSAHLDAATARPLDLIRDFDERGGWSNGFRSCAEWLTWRIGLDPGAARERVRVARQRPRSHSGRDAGNGRATTRRWPGWYREARRAHRARLAAGRSQGRSAGDGAAAPRPLVAGAGGSSPRSARSCSRPWRPRATSCVGGRTRTTLLQKRAPTTCRTRGNSSRLTRWRCSPRQRCIRASTQAHRPSAIRSSSTSTRRCLRMPMRPGSRSSKTEPTLLQKRRSVWRATRHEW